jgi:hypothetical protein
MTWRTMADKQSFVAKPARFSCLITPMVAASLH